MSLGVVIEKTTRNPKRRLKRQIPCVRCVPQIYR